MVVVCLSVCLFACLPVCRPYCGLYHPLWLSFQTVPSILSLHVLHNFDYFLVCVSPRLTVQYVHLLYDNVGLKECANIPLDFQP